MPGPDADKATHEPQEPADLVARLKAEGVAFEGCSEERAADLLSGTVYYEQLSCYLPLFERRAGGPRDGQFVSLDFSQLLALRRADQRVGTTLLAVVTRVEGAVRARLHSQALRSERPGGGPEDMHGIVADYFAGLSDENLAYRTHELERLGEDGYAGRLYRKHRGRMPLGVYLQCAMLGALCDLTLFCARRWHDEGLRQMHYMLKDVRRLRNDLAHGSPVLCNLVSGGFDGPAKRTALATRLSELGVSRRTRGRQLDCPQTIRIASLICLAYLLQPTKEEAGDIKVAFSDFRDASACLLKSIPPENRAASRLAFLADLTTRAGGIQ